MNSAYHRRVALPSELGNSTSSQLRSTSPVLIVPVGSTEQHGPHLPLDTDTRIASAVAGAAATRLAAGADGRQFMVAPAVAYGASGEHQGFPGTVSIGSAALELVLLEFGRSVSDWAAGWFLSMVMVGMSARWQPRSADYGSRAATRPGVPARCAVGMPMLGTQKPLYCYIFRHLMSGSRNPAPVTVRRW